MKHIWAVASGVNEDYSVLCCFSTRAGAIFYAAWLNGLSIEDITRLEELRHLRPIGSMARKERFEIEARAERRQYDPVYVQEFGLDPDEAARAAAEVEKE